MAMTFNSKNCANAAEKLNSASKTLDTILNTDLNNNVNKAMNVYQSDTSTKLNEAYGNIKAKFPDFVNAIKECSDYLVQMSAKYAEIEATAQSKIEI